MITIPGLCLVIVGMFSLHFLFGQFIEWHSKLYAANSEQRWIVNHIHKEGITNMRPIDFKESNQVYTAPAGSENVEDLHVNLATREDGSPSMLSVWAIDPDELESIRSGRGLIMLEVFGDSHPVVGLRVVEREEVVKR